MARAELVRQALNVPDLAGLTSRLRSNDPQLGAHMTRAIIGAPIDELPESVRELARRSSERAIEGAKRAIPKIERDGETANLDPDEVFGTEAIVLAWGRPAILIQDDHFFPPPDPWQVLEDHRADIERLALSVGRIEVSGHPSLDWIGTGFLIAEDVVMTNRHVAKEFCRQQGSGWTFESGMKARIDYKEEVGGTSQAQFALDTVIGVHDTIDFALFRASRRSSPSGAARPKPMPLAATRMKRGRQLYVVGYPASDSRRNDAAVMERIFTSVYNVKRLQPGECRGSQPSKKTFTHDCSTLGGNSGSPVVDLTTELVVGIHFQGRYLENNHAFAFADIHRDPLFKKAGVEFTAA